jgi:hypothetical protein
MLGGLRRGSFGKGWRKRMLITGSKAVGPNGSNKGGANNPSGRWWLLREGSAAFILHENGTKELYWLKSDPHQLRNRRQAPEQSLIDPPYGDDESHEGCRGAGEKTTRTEVRGWLSLRARRPRMRYP